MNVKTVFILCVARTDETNVLTDLLDCYLRNSGKTGVLHETTCSSSPISWLPFSMFSCCCGTAQLGPLLFPFLSFCQERLGNWKLHLTNSASKHEREGYQESHQLPYEAEPDPAGPSAEGSMRGLGWRCLLEYWQHFSRPKRACLSCAGLFFMWLLAVFLFFFFPLIFSFCNLCSICTLISPYSVLWCSLLVQLSDGNCGNIVWSYSDLLHMESKLYVLVKYCVLYEKNVF